MSEITIRIGSESGRVFVKSPFNKAFVARARELNGKWVASSSEWAFDGRDEARVREACIELYGNDGSTQASLVTLRVTLGSWDGPDITLGGRSLVRRRGRDYRVNLGEGVVVLEGGFPSCGGSMKNPRVDPQDGTVLEVRDFPESLARTLVPDAGRGSSGFAVEIVSAQLPPTPAVDESTKADAIAQIKSLMAQHCITVGELQ